MGVETVGVITVVILTGRFPKIDTGESIIIIISPALHFTHRSLHLFNRLCLHLPHHVGEGLDEVAVVRHRQDGAGEGRQRLLEARPRGDIQVVDRLIQQQQVAALRHQAGQREPRALAKTELADRREHIVALEQVQREEGARLGLVLEGVPAGWW